MSLADLLARGAATAEARMLSRVTVHRRTGRLQQNESTGAEDLALDQIYTDLPFRLDGSSTGDGGSQTVDIDGVVYQAATCVGHLPISTLDLADGDLIEVTSGEWVGTVWRVVKAVRKDQATARRVPIVEAVL